MATGVVGGSGGSFGNTFQTGQVVSSQRMADIGATLDVLYNFKNQDRSIWVHPSACRFVGGTVGDPANAVGAVIWTSAAGGYASLAVPIFFFSATVGLELTNVDVKVTQGGATGMTVALWEANNMSAALDPADGTDFGTSVASQTGAAGAGLKTITLSSLSRFQKPDVLLWLKITPAQNNDILWGVKFTYDQSAYV